MMKISHVHGLRIRLTNGRTDLVPARDFMIEAGVLLTQGGPKRAYAPGQWEYVELDLRDHPPGFDG